MQGDLSERARARVAEEYGLTRAEFEEMRAAGLTLAEWRRGERAAHRAVDEMRAWAQRECGLARHPEAAVIPRRFMGRGQVVAGHGGAGARARPFRHGGRRGRVGRHVRELPVSEGGREREAQ